MLFDKLTTLDPGVRRDDSGYWDDRRIPSWIPACVGMTVVIGTTVEFPSSSRRTPGSSVFRGLRDGVEHDEYKPALP